jgi:hypothetical protein
MVMSRILGLLVIVALVVGAIGYYRGWLATETSRDDQKTNINLSVDREKMQQDVDALKRKAGSIVEKK